ncbi:MAG: SUMF1/EgtB/PvdO family nonheme iron enzyme, partial [Candidatus Nanopelagicales bacterium]
DSCVNGVCVHTPIVCDDGDPCTIDECVDGECVSTPLPCDDGIPCTIDTCVGGECFHEWIPGCVETCNNGIDDDGDGLIDCDDPECDGSDFCFQGWATILEASPDPEVVTDAGLRAAIDDAGLPWRIRDNATGIEMLLVPAGNFEMGCSPSVTMGGVVYGCAISELPVHDVELTSPFYLARYETTNDEWIRLMGSAGLPPYADYSPDLPARQVSWARAMDFASRACLRLPTEAEWEFACRAGTSTAFNGGSDVHSSLQELAWFDTSSERAVGLKQANPLGFHDMHGNVSEWCQDWFGDFYYQSGEVIDPTGPVEGWYRVKRGGSYLLPAQSCTSSRRSYGVAPSDGVRFARTPESAESRVEVCGNGLDDDCDGLTDCEDPDCVDAPGCCDDESITFALGDFTLAGGESQTVTIVANGLPIGLSVSFEFVTSGGDVQASDLVLVIDDGVNPRPYWGGYDLSFNGENFSGSWPFAGPGSAAAGPYEGEVSITTPGALRLGGTVAVTIGNGYSASPSVEYRNLTITIRGLCLNEQEICGNGLDDDGDGLIDCDDPNCVDVLECPLVVADTMDQSLAWGMYEWDLAGSGATTAQHQPSGGNPDALRRVDAAVSGGGGTVVSSHTHLAGRWTPSVDGAIDAIEFGIDYRNAAPAPAAAVQRIGVFAEQGGRRFFGSVRTIGESADVWNRAEYTGLTADDFLSWDGGDGPDFSTAGPPIAFGFYVEVSSVADAVSVAVLLDNFHLRVDP